MICLMLDPRFKGLEVIVDYIGYEVTKQVVDDYDHKILVPLWLKFFHLLLQLPFQLPLSYSETSFLVLQLR